MIHLWIKNNIYSNIFIGTTRIVFILHNNVIKIPNFLYSHNNFLMGCYANWSERNYCKMFKGMSEYIDKVAPSVYCSIFGLIQIQRKCIHLTRELTDDELEYFKNVRGGETKSFNFGIYNNKIVCLDYPN